MKAHKVSGSGVSGKGGVSRTNVFITVGCNHSLPCLALKIRGKKLLLNKSDKEWRIWFSFSFSSTSLSQYFVSYLWMQWNEMSFHCFVGIFVNYFLHGWRGIGSVWTCFEYILVLLRISQSTNATRGFFFFYCSYKGIGYIVSTQLIIC